MPVKTDIGPKGTSPSKNIQRGNDQAWGKQKGTTSPQEAINQQWNKNPVKGNGK